MCLLLPEAVSSREELRHMELGTVGSEAYTIGVETLVGGGRAVICGLDRLQKSRIHPFSQAAELLLI